MYLRQRLPQPPSLKASPRSMDVLISNGTFRNWITLSGALAPETPKVNSSPGWKVGWWVLLMANFLDDLWAFFLVGSWNLPSFFSPLGRPPIHENSLPPRWYNSPSRRRHGFQPESWVAGCDFCRCDGPVIFHESGVAGKVKESVPAVPADPVVPASADRDVLSEIFVKMVFPTSEPGFFTLKTWKKNCVEVMQLQRKTQAILW